jgi:diguanylate cyclase (GGDEF)-like protein
LLIGPLYRPLASDEDRATYWVGHVRVGVVLSLASALMLMGYAAATMHRPHRGLIVAVSAAVVLASPLLLLLPMRQMARDYRGPIFFYAWSVVLTALIAVLAGLDGGGRSPLVLLFSLTLTYAAVAYPPAGVGLVGSLMIAAELLVIGAGPAMPLGEAALPAGVLAIFTVMAAWASHNQWKAYDAQVQQTRIQQTLATTDALTGCLNRRAFLDRLDAMTAGTSGAPAVAVCVIDLDGFKAVNDTRGHATGDAVLTEVSAALEAAVGDDGTVARLGGDEFAALVRGSREAAAEVFERVRAAVAAAGAPYAVTASVGAARIGPHDTGSQVLHRADLAMYAAKYHGGDRVSDRPDPALATTP